MKKMITVCLMFVVSIGWLSPTASLAELPPHAALAYKDLVGMSMNNLRFYEVAALHPDGTVNFDAPGVWVLAQVKETQQKCSVLELGGYVPTSTPEVLYDFANCPLGYALKGGLTDTAGAKLADTVSCVLPIIGLPNFFIYSLNGDLLLSGTPGGILVWRDSAAVLWLNVGAPADEAR